MWQTAIRNLSPIPKAGAASILAMLMAGCASHAGYYGRNHQDGDIGRQAGGADGADGGAIDYDPNSDNYARTGIAAARDAHVRYSDYRAEQLDGGCERRVRIEFGETLSDLAEFCDVPVAAIVDANPGIGNPRYISVGQQVHIPNTYGQVYEGGLRGYGYSDAEYRDHYMPGRVVDRQGERDYYVVRRGDTLGEIARHYDISLGQIHRLNPNLDPRDLEIGSRVYLPSDARLAQNSGDPWRRDGSLASDAPVISITPGRGPRDGRINVTCDRLQRGEQVTVYYGDSREGLVPLKVVQADEYGRINDVVTLPETYGHDKAYFAVQHGADYFMSDAYAVERVNDASRDQVAEFASGSAGQGDTAVLTARDRDVYRGGKVTLSAHGFPANTPVSIYGGPNREALIKIAQTRTGARGIFEAEVGIPDNVNGDYAVFVAAVEDGARTYFTERVRVRTDDGARLGGDFGDIDADGPDGGYGDASLSTVYPQPVDHAVDLTATSPTTLDRGIERGGRRAGLSIFSRFRKNNIRDQVGVNAGGHSAISGVLTNEGVDCPALRDDSGKLYTLLGDLKGFDDGDRVLIGGSAAADDRICGQAETVQVFSIAKAPW